MPIFKLFFIDTDQSVGQLFVFGKESVLPVENTDVGDSLFCFERLQNLFGALSVFKQQRSGDIVRDNFGVTGQFRLHLLLLHQIIHRDIECGEDDDAEYRNRQGTDDHLGLHRSVQKKVPKIFQVFSVQGWPSSGAWSSDIFWRL